jgi:3-oxoacyl-[acyl-carrier-protein] synthase-3
MSFGIVATGHALGDPCSVDQEAPAYTGNPDRVRAWGYRTFHRAADRVGITDLATTAARHALARAGVTADQIDLVVLAMTDIPERLYWDAAAATQARLGAKHAAAVLVNQACSSGVMAFDAVAGRFATHPDCQLALLIAANRVCEPYWNRMESCTAVMSDGAAAAIMARGHDRCQWLATEVISDGRYADFSSLSSGGAAQPFTAGAAAPEPVGAPRQLMEEFLGHDVRRLVEFSRLSRENTRTVFERACKRAGLTPADVRHMVYMNGTAKALHEFALAFGLPPENTNADIAPDYGHLGCADQLLAFGVMLDQGRFEDGTVVALNSAGNGMHWACTMLRV